MENWYRWCPYTDFLTVLARRPSADTEKKRTPRRLEGGNSDERHQTSHHQHPSTHKDGRWNGVIFLTASSSLSSLSHFSPQGFSDLSPSGQKRTPDRPSTAPNPHSPTVDFCCGVLPRREPKSGGRLDTPVAWVRSPDLLGCPTVTLPWTSLRKLVCHAFSVLRRTERQGGTVLRTIRKYITFGNISKPSPHSTLLRLCLTKEWHRVGSSSGFRMGYGQNAAGMNPLPFLLRPALSLKLSAGIRPDTIASSRNLKPGVVDHFQCSFRHTPSLATSVRIFSLVIVTKSSRILLELR